MSQNFNFENSIRQMKLLVNTPMDQNLAGEKVTDIFRDIPRDQWDPLVKTFNERYRAVSARWKYHNSYDPITGERIVGLTPIELPKGFAHQPLQESFFTASPNMGGAKHNPLMSTYESFQRHAARNNVGMTGSRLINTFQMAGAIPGFLKNETGRYLNFKKEQKDDQ